MKTIETFGHYQLGTCLDLDKETKDSLIRLFETAPPASEGILAGRIRPIQADIPGVGAVIVKNYRRGGIIRHFNKDRYLGLGTPRSQLEYEMLETVRALSVSAPEPLVWAIRGHLVYKAFLVTRKIEGQRSLSDIGARDPERCQTALGKTAAQIRLLIESQIHHVDLHPGNVLVDEGGRVYLIDFDKARRVRWRREKLCAVYISRWKKAVEKYSLPASMTDQLAAGIAKG